MQVTRDGIPPEDMARQSEREQEIAAARDAVCAHSRAIEPLFDECSTAVPAELYMPLLRLGRAVAELRRLEGK